MSWKEEYWRTIKSFDTEEKLDLYFYRPVGFVIAKFARFLHMTPDMLTVIGASLGIAGGFFFYQIQDPRSLWIACALLILAGLFDSSDGQLARMGGKGTKFGLVLDGICDNIVFGAAYIGSVLAIQGDWNAYVLWSIAIIAGICHSFESSVLDYYNREYLVFGYGKLDGDYWNPSDEEAQHEVAIASGRDRLLLKMRLSWIWQQNKLSSRSQKTRNEWRKLLGSPHGATFMGLYREHNRVILRAWRLMGANFHTMMILLFVFLRRFDLYLILIDILFLPLALLVLRALQAKQDDLLNKAITARGLA